MRRADQKITPVLFILALIISTVIKVIAVYGNNFAFTMDQGRDLVDVRQMVVTRIPKLIGPTTSINGVYLGPFYYYFITVPFVLSGGNPAAIVYWQIFWFQLATVILWWVIRKKDSILADITGILLLLSPVGFYTARFFWNANAMPIFTILFFASLLYTLWHKSYWSLLILGLVGGLSLQIEAAFGILFFPFCLIFLLIKKFSVKDLLKISAAFLVTLIPQAFFELRHGFLMTKTLLAGLSGASDILGEKLSFAAKIIQRKAVFMGILQDTNHVPFEILKIILTFSLILGVYYLFKSKSKVSREILSESLFFIFLSFIFYLIFPQQVKSWYVSGLAVPVIIYFSVVLANFFDENLLGKLVVWTFILFTFFHVYLAHSEYLYRNALKSGNDPSGLSNQLKAIDWVYAQADGKGFRIYSYLPSVYDFPYQYLFWWYGTKIYGYQPADIAYLPGQPEYIKNSVSFWTKKKPVDNTGPTFLIIESDSEHPDRMLAWKGNFSKLCEVTKTRIVDNLSVLMLSSCSK